MYLVIIFCSPLYFLVRGKLLPLILNSILYGLALLTIMFGVGFFFWLLAVGHASWHLRRELMQEQARMIAAAMQQPGRGPA